MTGPDLFELFSRKKVTFLTIQGNMAPDPYETLLLWGYICIIKLKMVTSFPLHTLRHFGLRSAVSLLYCRLRQKHCSALSLSTQTPLVQMLDSAIHQIKYNYSVDNCYGNQWGYPVDIDLSFR